MTEAGTCRPGGAAFVILAGGSGSRVGAEQNKVYLPLAGRPVLSWSLAWATEVLEIGPIVLVIRPQDEQQAAEAVAAAGLTGAVRFVPGGSTRHRSEQAALDQLAEPIRAGSVQIVVIHDGARPLAGPPLLREVIRVAAADGGAVPSLPEQTAWPIDATGRLRPPELDHTLHRVQTPQAFRAAVLLEAYAAALRSGSEGTDTSAALEGLPGLQVTSVPGHPENLKVTYVEDLLRAEALLNQTDRPGYRAP